MNKTWRYVLTGIFFAAILALGWWWMGREAQGSRHQIRATGTIEVEMVAIASEMGGRIVEITVDKGDEVREGDVLVRLETDMIDADLARTEAAIQSLEKARDAAREAWRAAQAASANPQEIELRIAEIQAQLDAAELQLQAAQLAGDPQQVQLAQTTRDGLQRVLDLLTTMRDEPYALEAQASQAEMLYQGLEDTVYLPETAYGRVRLGDSVAVYVDSWPERTFTGTVTYISPQAEFTPANVQTPDERARLVYAVEITLPNDDLALKPGMIADAVFEENP